MQEETIVVDMKKEEFSVKLKQYVTEMNMAYIDAIIKLCEDNGLEYEEVPNLIDAKTKMFIENEYREMNYLPRVATLPL